MEPINSKTWALDPSRACLGEAVDIKLWCSFCFCRISWWGSSKNTTDRNSLKASQFYLASATLMAPCMGIEMDANPDGVRCPLCCNPAVRPSITSDTDLPSGQGEIRLVSLRASTIHFVRKFCWRPEDCQEQSGNSPAFSSYQDPQLVPH